MKSLDAVIRDVYGPVRIRESCHDLGHLLDCKYDVPITEEHRHADGCFHLNIDNTEMVMPGKHGGKKGKGGKRGGKKGGGRKGY